MSLIGRLIGKKKAKLNESNRVSVTDKGRIEARKYLSHRLDYEILSNIADRGNPTISELTEEVQRPIETVKQAVISLEKRGLVIILSTGEEQF